MKVEEFLSPGGVLSVALERYEHRPQQVEMALAVERALRERRPLIVEAATGTGKTLAYLIPALLSGKRVVVSTGTRALQEQLFDKDVPFLQEHLPKSFKAVLLKGRRNYLCLDRFEEMERRPRFRSMDEVSVWSGLKAWARTTESGDRAEVEGMPDDYKPWSELSVGAEACLGSKCKFWSECFVQKARRRAQEADLIVVNHHLFFADLSLRDAGVGEILPEYDAVIFDEAHHLEEVATEYFGLQVSNYRFGELVGDVERALDEEEVMGPAADRVRELSGALEEAAAGFFDLLRERVIDGRWELTGVLARGEEALWKGAYRGVMGSLDKLGEVVGGAGLGEVGTRLRERCGELSGELEEIVGGRDARYAYLLERRDRGIFLQAAPIDLADELRAKLVETHDSLVFTSATLATGGDFSYMRRRLGLSEVEVEEVILAPVFAYEEQSLLYVPRKLPAPRDPKFGENVALIVEYLLKVTEGRAFVLFTSYQNMEEVYGRLQGRVEYPMMMQGELSKRELMERFRREDHAVLFGTASFWEGVDVEGEDLSLVVIDKLPFASPSDPLMAARLRRVDEEGGNSFAEVSLPMAAITLRQGFGRLIRSKQDRGVVAILDSRLAHRGYGSYFLKSLPPAPVVWTAPQVKRWWRGREES